MNIKKIARSKKWKAMLLTAAMILSMVPLTLVTVFAAGESFEWEVDKYVDQVLAMNEFYDEGEHTWHIDSGSMPTGLNIYPESGDRYTEFKITGIPTVAGEIGAVEISFLTADGLSNYRYSFEYEITAQWEFSIEVKDDGNGMGSASQTVAEVGTEITLTAVPNEGYEFDFWSTPQDYPEIVDNRFIMPAEDVVVTAHFKEVESTGGGRYTITVLNDGNGTGSASLTIANEGTEITLTAVPNEGYEFDYWSTVQNYPVIENNRFIMPAEDVVVTAHFRPVYNPPEPGNQYVPRDPQDDYIDEPRDPQDENISEDLEDPFVPLDDFQDEEFEDPIIPLDDAPSDSLPQTGITNYDLAIVVLLLLSAMLFTCGGVYLKRIRSKEN